MFSLQEWPTSLGYLVFLYLFLVRFMRYRRKNHADALYPDRASYKLMTLENAFNIQIALAELEFPRIFSSSIFFALFKVSRPNIAAEGVAPKSALIDIWNSVHIAATRFYGAASRRDNSLETSS